MIGGLPGWRKYRGSTSKARAQEEARENLKDALQTVLEANRELAEKEHKPTRREELVIA